MNTRAREVLIVEDDVSIQRLLSTLAARNGLAPVLASDGRSALDLLESADYDAMVLDLNLPGVNGFDILRHVAAENPSLLDRTIVITSADERMYRNSPHIRHTHALLRKPFDIAKLQDEMLACCQSH
ncbi:MAG TPA: response regulator [Thermoanaerobaculia bacterium]|nr:response regulator [Thermoanaerobaculia bacterium]